MGQLIEYCSDLQTAGPRALSDAFHNYLFREDCPALRRVKILDPEVIFPLDWRHASADIMYKCREEKGPEAEANCKKILATNNTVAITYWYEIIFFYVFTLLLYRAHRVNRFSVST